MPVACVSVLAEQEVGTALAVALAVAVGLLDLIPCLHGPAFPAAPARVCCNDPGVRTRRLVYLFGQLSSEYTAIADEEDCTDRDSVFGSI